ncbi:hypothetical protein [Actinomadura chokoriensis]|uniref:hypothetical protein n=1 Tax=Actinomadura chokoriensis TaxID=454156 RepID=UPI0031F8D6D4
MGGGRVPFTSGNSDLRNSYLDGCVRALLFGRFVHGELWSYREEGGRGRPVRLEFHQGLLYVFWTSSVDNRGGDISLFALDPGSGQRVWTFPAQGVSMSADGAFHNGVLYVSALERKDTFSAVALPDRADLPDGEPDDGEPDRGGQDEGARDAGGRLLRRWGRRYRSAG